MVCTSTERLSNWSSLVSSSCLRSARLSVSSQRNERGERALARCLRERAGEPSALAPALEQVIFVGIKLTGTEWSRSRQGWLWRLPEVLSDGIASYTKFFPNLAQAHPRRMQVLHLLIQFPFA